MRQEQPSCGGHIKQLNTQTAHCLLPQEPSRKVPKTTWATRFASAAAGSWVQHITVGKKWEISSVPCSLPAGIDSNATQKLVWETKRPFLTLCFPSPWPSYGGTPTSPFPSLHQVPPDPPHPRLDEEKHHTWGQHPAPAASSGLSPTPIPKTDDFCFSRRRAAKDMPACFCTWLDLQHRSTRRDICATQNEM